MSLILQIEGVSLPESDLLELPKTEESFYFDEGKIIPGSMDFILNNISNKYDDTLPGNILYGEGWYNKKVDMWNTTLNRYFWRGKLKNIVRNFEEGKITLKTENYISDLKKTCIYSNTADKCPALVIYEIMTVVAGIPSDMIYYRGFQKAINQQDAAGFFIKLEFTGTDNLDCQSVITELCRISQCSLYGRDNIVHLYQWEEPAPGLTYKITDSDIIGNKFNEEYEEKNLFNAYNIAYDNSGTVAFATGFDSASKDEYGLKTFSVPDKPIESTASSAYKILCKTQTAANYAGSLAILRRKHLQKICTVEIIDDADVNIGEDVLLSYKSYSREPILIENRKYDIKNKSYLLGCRFSNIPFQYYERDTEAPDPVEIIFAISYQKNIFLKWTRPAQSDLLGFMIYFTTTKGEWNSEQCITGMSPLEIKVDDVVMTKDGYCSLVLYQLYPETEYSIKIRSFDDSYNESEDSNIIQVYVHESEGEDFFNCSGNPFIKIENDELNLLGGNPPEDWSKFDTAEFDVDSFTPSSSYVSEIFESASAFSGFEIYASNRCYIFFRSYVSGSPSLWSSPVAVSKSKCLMFNMTFQKIQLMVFIDEDLYDSSDWFYIKKIYEV